MIKAVTAATAKCERYSSVLDGRFKGGYITRHYGDPANGVHAIQLELTQRSYMNEDSLQFAEEPASHLRELLSRVLQAYLRGPE